MYSQLSPQAFPQPEFQKDLVLSVLKQAAVNELLTCNLYQQVRIKSPTQDLLDMAQSASLEDWGHYKILLECIDHLTTTTSNIDLSPNRIQAPEDLSQANLLKKIEKAELTAINYQHSLCAMTFGHDFKIFDHAYALLNENMQHNRQVNECLNNRI